MSLAEQREANARDLEDTQRTMDAFRAREMRRLENRYGWVRREIVFHPAEEFL